VRDIVDPEAKRALKNSRFALQKNPWNLNEIETTKLADVQRVNMRPHRAYLLKESLAAILDRRQPHVAETQALGRSPGATWLTPFARSRNMRGPPRRHR
jgi:transposase